MKMLLVLAVAVTPVPLAAQEDSGRAAASTDPDRVVCRAIADIGSRLRTRRVCNTRAGWQDLRRMQRDFSEEIQARGGNKNRG